jgi:uncharacterized membrane protein
MLWTLHHRRPGAMNTPAPEPHGAPPKDTTFLVPIRQQGLGAPFRWLVAGTRDFFRCPFIGLFYGNCFALMGWLLLAVFQHAPAYTLALSAGFLLMGPLLCLGLYQASYRLERGETPEFADCLLAWDKRIGPLAIFGIVLLILEMLWGRAALVVFAVSFDGMPDFKGSVMSLLAAENITFIVAYLAVGGVFAGLIYAISVVAIPMILHQPTDAVTAGLTSMRLVLGQPLVMLLWGGIIAVLVGVAMLPWFGGLLVVGPIVGHATWHAYRAAVDAPLEQPGAPAPLAATHAVLAAPSTPSAPSASPDKDNTTGA